MRRKLQLGALLTIASLLCGAAQADLVITITEAADGGFTIAGTGSGTASLDSDVDEDDWDFNDFDTNFVANGAVDGVAPDSISGTIRNVTTNTDTAITSLRIDSDLLTTGADDFTIKSDPTTFLAGQEFEINFSGTYLNATLPFSDLNVGAFTLTPSAGDDEEIFGTITVNVVSAVPEPSSATLLIMGGAGLLSYRRKKR